MILAVDTSLGSAVAVIDDDGQVVARAESPDATGHAEVIGSLLTQVVQPDVTRVVAGMGPGPFTGLRIGIAAARAFATGRGIEVVAIPSHYAPALDELDAGATDAFAIVTDARRREAAVTVFEGRDDDGIPRITRDTTLVKQADLETHLEGIRRVDVTTLDAAALARVGQRAVAAGRTLAGSEPLYLRHPDVAPPSAPKRVST